MPKATLQFDLGDPIEKRAHMRAVTADAAYIAMHETIIKVFRPARKHGYHDEEIQKLLDKCGENGVELIGKLEDVFADILHNLSIDLDYLE